MDEDRIEVGSLVRVVGEVEEHFAVGGDRKIKVEKMGTPFAYCPALVRPLTPLVFPQRSSTISISRPSTTSTSRNCTARSTASRSTCRGASPRSRRTKHRGGKASPRVKHLQAPLGALRRCAETCALPDSAPKRLTRFRSRAEPLPLPYQARHCRHYFPQLHSLPPQAHSRPPRRFPLPQLEPDVHLPCLEPGLARRWQVQQGGPRRASSAIHAR